jgi:hypothetical protein
LSKGGVFTLKSEAAVVLSLIGLAVISGGGYVAYKEYKMNQCAANGGKWTGNLLTGSCPTSSTSTSAPSTPAFTTFTATAVDANGNSTITAAWTSETGATSYTLTVAGQTVYTGDDTFWSGTVNVGTTATSVAGTICACN